MDAVRLVERTPLAALFAVLVALPAAALAPGPSLPFGYSQALVAVAFLGVPLTAGLVAIDAPNRRLFRGLAVLVVGATPLAAVVLVALPAVGADGSVPRVAALATVWAFTYGFGWRNGWARVASHLPVLSAERHTAGG